MAIPKIDQREIQKRVKELTDALVEARAELAKAKRAGFDVQEQEKSLRDLENKVRMVKRVYGSVRG